jgi:hypothetical protein
MSKNLKKSASGKASENLRVVVRCRNLLPAELERGDTPCVKLDLATHQAVVQSPGDTPQVFAFDSVYTNFHSQKEIFLKEVFPMIEAVLQGYNATVFAYGQSGSGKTYTMTGNIADSNLWGMMPQTVQSLFSEIRKISTAGNFFKVKCSYIELYNGKARDLLTSKQTTLDIKENSAKNFYVKGVETPEISSLEECLKLFNAGTERRQTASTELNDQSSRSHSLFVLQVEQHDAESDPSSPTVFSSKINIVDLAGSEKLAKSGATGATAVEGCSINLSLSALAAVIDTIVKGGPHIPYRSSPLTMLLKDSLGGNAKTVMFANLGPSDRNAAETLSTLRFALRAKQIENKPIKNMDPKDARIAELLEKVEELHKKNGSSNHNQEIERLTNRLDFLEVERADYAKNLETTELELGLEVKRVRYELDEMERSRKTLDGEVNRLRDRIGSLEASLVHEQRVAQEIRSTVRDFLRRGLIQDQLDELQKRMRRGSDGLGGQWAATDIQNHFDQLLQQLQAQQQALKSAEQLRKQAVADLEEKSAQVMHLQDELSAARMGDGAKREKEAEKTTSLMAEVTRLSSELKVAKNIAEERAAQLSKIESQLKSEISRLQQENKKLQQSKGEPSSGVRVPQPPGHRNSVQEAASVSGELAALREENESLRAQLTRERDAMRRQIPVRFSPHVARTSPNGKKPSTQQAPVSIAIDMIRGIPTETWCVRVLAYMADLDEDDAVTIDSDTLYDRLPDILCVQDLASPTCEPTFSSEDSTRSVFVTDNSRAVLIVECLFGKQWATYGHAVLPIGRALTRKGGCFSTRLRLGDPRQNRNSSENADLEQYAAVLRSRLALVPGTVDEYIPLAVVQWRKDAAVGPRQKWDLVDSPPFSAAEELMKKDRAGLPAAALERSPKLCGINSADDVAKAFEDSKRAQDCGDAMSLFSPYTKDRSCFIWIEKVVGLFPSDVKKAQAPADRLLKVLARVDDSFGFSKFHDFSAHCNFPTFLLDPILFPNLPEDDKLCVWLTVFTVSTKPKAPNGTESDAEAIVPIAWSVAKLFIGKHFLRHGRISVPLFEGTAPPPEFVEELNHVSLEEAIVNFLSQEKITYYSPRSLIVLAQGDAVRLEEVTGRLEPAPRSSTGGSLSKAPGPYAHRCKRKLVRRLNIPEFDVLEMMPQASGDGAPTLEKAVMRLLPDETIKGLQNRINDRVTEYMKAGGLEEFKTGERKLQRSKSLFQRFFN